MDDFRKIIENNRGLFDDQEPAAGHIGRFEALLDKQSASDKKPRQKVRLMWALSAVASIAVLFFIGIKIFIPDNGQMATTTITPTENNSLSEEFIATNDYYNQQMEERIANIMCKLVQTDEENQKQLIADLEKIRVKNTEFVKEMRVNENTEVALHFLVKHYKTNIQVLKNIDEKLGKYANC